jgi:hypothetical protein
MLEAFTIGREVTRQPAFARLTAAELVPGESVSDADAAGYVFHNLTSEREIMIAERIFDRVYRRSRPAHLSRQSSMSSQRVQSEHGCRQMNRRQSP